MRTELFRGKLNFDFGKLLAYNCTGMVTQRERYRGTKDFEDHCEYSSAFVVVLPIIATRHMAADLSVRALGIS